MTTSITTNPVEVARRAEEIQRRYIHAVDALFALDLLLRDSLAAVPIEHLAGYMFASDNPVISPDPDAAPRLIELANEIRLNLDDVAEAL